MDANVALSILILILVGFPMVAILVIMLFDSMGSKKTKFLYFDTPNHARLINEYIKEGKVKIGKKEYSIGDTKPKLIRSGTLFRVFQPMYILRWNYPHPYKWDDKNVEVKLTSESVKLLSRNTTLETLLKGGGGGGMWIWLLLGIVIGAMIGYILVSSGILPSSAVSTAANATARATGH